MADSPEWTDINESDPGITILELLTFLAVGYFFMNSLGSLLERLGLVTRVVNVQVDGGPQVQTPEDAGPDASVFSLDRTSGSVQFGDGRHGRVPSGWVQTSSRYRYGAGAVAVIGAVVVLCGLWSLSIWRRWRRRRKSGD